MGFVFKDHRSGGGHRCWEK